MHAKQFEKPGSAAKKMANCFLWPKVVTAF